MKATMRCVMVGEPVTQSTERTYPGTDGKPRKSTLTYIQLLVNELPETPTGKVPKWNVAVFRGQNPRLEHDITKFYFRNEEKLKSGTHFVNLPVTVNPNPKRDSDHNVINERNGFGGVSLRGEPEIIEAQGDEVTLVEAAIKVKQVEVD